MPHSVPILVLPWLVACVATEPLGPDAMLALPGASLGDSGGGEALPDLPVQAGRWNDVTLLTPGPVAERNPHPEGFRTKTTLMFVATFQGRDGQPRVFGGTGEPAQDGAYTLDRGRHFHVEATRDEAGRLATAPFTMNFVFGIDRMDLILYDAKLENQLTLPSVIRPEVDVVAAGDFVAVLTPDNAERVHVNAVFTLKDYLMSVSGLVPDVDWNDDGVAESWRFKYHFETEDVTLY